MGKVFILGAGFSRWISDEMPLLSDLSKNLPSDLRKKVENENLSKLLDPSQFEQLISYLSGDYPWKKKYEIDRQLALFREISDYVIEFIEKKENKAVKHKINSDNEKLKRIIDILKYSGKIISFNYDTLLEKLFDLHFGVKPWHKYWDLPINNVRHRSNSQVQMGMSSDVENIMLTKLHGSMNWLRSDNYPDSNEPVYYKQYKELTTDLRTNMYGLSPFIIPPAMDKNSFLKHNLISVMWERARRQIQGAKELVIMGYSIPLSDTYIDLLFSATLNSSQKITIVDTNSNENFRNRIVGYFVGKYSCEVDTQYLSENAIDRYIANNI